MKGLIVCILGLVLITVAAPGHAAPDAVSRADAKATASPSAQATDHDSLLTSSDPTHSTDASCACESGIACPVCHSPALIYQAALVHFESLASGPAPSQFIQPEPADLQSLRRPPRA